MIKHYQSKEFRENNITSRIMLKTLSKTLK